jgi:lysozyme
MSEAQAASLAKQFEGYRNMPYRDAAGIWTIGYGSTRDENGNPVTEATPPITEAEAMQLLLRDMQRAFDDIALAVKVPLTQSEKAATADLVYNIGAGAFNGSTLLKLLNAGDYQGAAKQFLAWDMAAGKVLAGLMNRRWAEMTTFQDGAD